MAEAEQVLMNLPAPEGRSILGPGTIRLTYARLVGERPKGRGMCAREGAALAR